MKKIIFIYCAFASFSQSDHRCITHEVMQHQESLTPGYLQGVNEIFDRAKNSQNQDRSTVYTIPVVFHVIHSVAAENIPDSVLFNQIDILNMAYGFTNADKVNLRDTFNTIVGSTDIQFELATIDPDGNPTNGITRTLTNVTEFSNASDTTFTQFTSSIERIKISADGGKDPWNQLHYLNIWIADMSIAINGQIITGLMGVCYPAS